LLNELLALANLDLSPLDELHRASIENLRSIIVNLTARMCAAQLALKEDAVREIVERLGGARTELAELIRTIQSQQPAFMSKGVDLRDFLAMIPTGGALVVPFTCAAGTAVFVVPPGRECVTNEDVLLLDRLLSPRIEFKTSRDVLDLYFDTFSRSLTPFLNRWLWDLNLQKGAPVLISPHGIFAVLPIHALYGDMGAWDFLEDYSVTYVPGGFALKSCRRLLQVCARLQDSLLAIVNPTADLQYAKAEVDGFEDLFKPHILRLDRQEATKETLIRSITGYKYVHFACHGFYDFEEPMHSGLKLAGGVSLTFEDIVAMNLNGTRLVVLSACETGLTDFMNLPNEFVGLPMAFLQAGASAVLSSLWAVDDISTMLLMRRFYELHFAEGQDISKSLRQAQIYLRNLTAGELADLFAAEEERLLRQSGAKIASMSDNFARFASQDPKNRPFKDLYYWAPFIIMGA
jgi:hypothetical protein